jgi:regulator of RNase E activity RraA
MDDSELLSRYRKYDAYTVGDAIRRVRCGGEIETLLPQTQTTVFVGFALTARIQVEQNITISVKDFGGWQLHDRTKLGDVAVLDAGALPYTATGAIAVTNLKRRGAVASVVNARIRDAEEIATIELPVFSRGVGIRSIVGRGYVTGVGEPVRIDGVSICTGDMLLGCRGGIVVVPRHQAEEVLKVAGQLTASDRAILNGMRRGERIERLWAAHKNLDETSILPRGASESLEE